MAKKITSKYKNVLFDNGRRVSVFSSHDTYSEALAAFNELIANNTYFFEKKHTWRGVPTKLELVLTAPKTNKHLEYIKNELNAVVEIKTTGKFSIKKIAEYHVEESFTDKLEGKQIMFKDLIKKHLKKNLTYCVLICNNKLVIECFEDSSKELYILKNKSDCWRLFDVLRRFAAANCLTNYLFFEIPAPDLKRRVYRELHVDYGISPVYMKKISTR